MLGFAPISTLPISTVVVFSESHQSYEQRYRVADDNLDLFELYVGEDGPPDFDASGQPVETSPTLSFSWTPTPPGSGDTLELHVVVRKRNRYDLQSFNVYETIIVIDSLGEQVPGPISTPQAVAVYDAATGYIRAVSKYDTSEDSDPADTWEVYVTEGADPVPGVDTPAWTGSMSFIGNESGLARTVGPFTPGVVAHVIVTALRSDDDERESAEVVQHTVAESLDLTIADIFGGSVYEQR